MSCSTSQLGFTTVELEKGVAKTYSHLLLNKMQDMSTIKFGKRNWEDILYKPVIGTLQIPSSKKGSKPQLQGKTIHGLVPDHPKILNRYQ